jgi:hypothetical protein
MKPLCHLEVCKFDLFLAGMPLNTKKIIVIDMLVVNTSEMLEARTKP